MSAVHQACRGLVGIVVTRTTITEKDGGDILKTNWNAFVYNDVQEDLSEALDTLMVSLFCTALIDGVSAGNSQSVKRV